jgi:hypothetical protein
MTTEIERMLANNSTQTPSASIQTLKEILQEVTLQILSQTDFFSHAAFYGGTALRIFYGLGRFSEDMDFSLQTKDPDFNMQTYLPAIEKGLGSYGFEMKAEYKTKQNLSNMQSAFLKGNTLILLMHLVSLVPPIPGIGDNSLIKIKLEVDISPPQGAHFEKKYRLLPQPYSATLYDKPSLFAGKLHALLCRNWKQREKGRDFYDYIWYLTEHIPVNLSHLEARMRQSGHWEAEEPLSLSTLKPLLMQRFASLDFEVIKKDVMPFIPDPKVLEIWSREFFNSITQDQLSAI